MLDKYYKSRGVDLRQVIVSGKRRKGVKKELVLEGADILYGKIKKGLVLHDVALASRIIAEAVALDRLGTLSVDSYNVRMLRLEEQVETLEETIQNTKWARFKLFMTKKRKLWGWWKDGIN